MISNNNVIDAAMALTELVNPGVDCRNTTEHPTLVSSAEGSLSGESSDIDKDDNSSEAGERLSFKRNRKHMFPEILMRVLSSTDETVTDSISWVPHGKAFIIHNPKKFEMNVMPRFFKAGKYSSFVRKLNRWGFKQSSSKLPDAGSFSHEFFCRGDLDSIKNMVCKRTGSVRGSNTSKKQQKQQLSANKLADTTHHSFCSLPQQGPLPNDAAADELLGQGGLSLREPAFLSQSHLLKAAAAAAYRADIIGYMRIRQRQQLKAAQLQIAIAAGLWQTE